MRRIALFAACLLVILALAGMFVPVTRWIDGNGYAMTDQEVEIRPSVEGAIDRWLVHNDEQVEKDQLLIQLANAVQLADFEQAQSQLKAKQAELSELISSQELDRSRRKEQALRAQQNLTLAEAYLERMKSSEGFSPKEVDEARLRASIARSELAELQLPVDDVRAKEIAVLREQIEAAERAVAAHDAQLKQREIRAPMAGTVQLNRFEPGEVVKPEHVLGQIFDRRSWVVKLSVPEPAIGYVKEGQPVQVALTAYPTLRYGYLRATISSIVPTVTPRPNAPGIIYVEARLDVPPNIDLQPGMTATAWIDTGKTTWLKRKFGW